MSLKESKKIETNLYQLTIDIDAATFAAAVDKVYRKSVKNITVPGFRRGKAPRSIIEKMYGTGVFYEDAINDLLPTVYPEALKESGIEAVSQPEFDIESVDENGVVLVAKVYVKPEVKLEGYKGIEVEKTVEETTDAEVRIEIDRVRERNSRMIEVTDRAAQTADTANIDYEGFVDGVPFDGGKAAGHDLILGSGQFIPGFEDQIIGHNVGDEFDVNVEFPAEYHAAELAGKPAVFKCKLNALKLKELPELDDEFARDVSDFDTLAEYEADVKAKLVERKAKQSDAIVDEKLVDALIEKLEAEIPEAMFEAETENFVRDYDNRLRMQGLDLKTYFQYTGLNLDALRAEMRPQAEKQVKSRLALEKVAELENIEVSEEETDAEYNRLAEAYGMEADKIKAMIAVEDLAADLKVKKAVELIRAEAVIKEAAPAKKAPAKKKSTTTKKKTTTKKATEAPAEEAPVAEATEAPAEAAADAE